MRVPGLVVFLLLYVAQAGVCLALLHASLSCYLGEGATAEEAGWSPRLSR